MDDQAVEQEIQAKDLNAPRITPEDIEALAGDVVYVVEQPSGTTSTFCHAYLYGSFYLASGHSACVSPANFDAELGMRIATKKARESARDKLWELEGYRLFRQECAA